MSMNYITTNIRIPEDDYLRLKTEAVKGRKSLSEVIREKIRLKKNKKISPEALMKRIRKHAQENAGYIPKGFDSVKALREIRYAGK